MIDGPENARRRAGKPGLLLLAGLFWLCAVTGGMLVLSGYSNSAGQEGQPPALWPSAGGVQREGNRATLVMFLHPQCPCSRATVGELALLMARCQGLVDARVFFLQPAEMPWNWCQTDLWRAAARIPGVSVERDDAGREARLFHAETSGDTMLYGAKGNLLFHGGITVSRGHAGDNAGRGPRSRICFWANRPLQPKRQPLGVLCSTAR